MEAYCAWFGSCTGEPNLVAWKSHQVCGVKTKRLWHLPRATQKKKRRLQRITSVFRIFRFMHDEGPVAGPYYTLLTVVYIGEGTSKAYHEDVHHLNWAALVDDFSRTCVKHTITVNCHDCWCLHIESDASCASGLPLHDILPAFHQHLQLLGEEMDPKKKFPKFLGKLLAFFWRPVCLALHQLCQLYLCHWLEAAGKFANSEPTETFKHAEWHQKKRPPPSTQKFDLVKPWKL